ncbi:hypothetical protein AF332_17020 [Sporosarcina globispora]|uniref:Sulphotransferase Stf0 domain-containing protein n=1 Tax=Sporosarcina globispora TaxID=1459 RepID=A0A0M0GEI9_SPOGL|nr:Stf0 family sulfotransferase [Sporosarcina globispora]KON88335.1 hypothetical protein AF332_17020 [Sporosarcina globispora]
MSKKKNLLKKIPEINFKEKNALVILSTQRSGSTMLCEDIISLGVLGTPDEHLRLVLNQKKMTAAEQLVDYFTSNGNLNDSSFYSIKLMYNHLDLLGYWISDRGLDTKTNKKKYREMALQFFLDKFDHVTFIYIQRKNKFEQALSYYRSAKTKVWHLRDGEKVDNNHSISYEEQKLLKNIDIKLFNKIYDMVCSRDRELKRLIKSQGIHYLSLVYEDIRIEYPVYLLDIGAEAGIKLNINSLEKRKIKKIVSSDFVSEFKKALLEKTDREYI